MLQRWVRMVVLLGLFAGLTVAVVLRARRPGPGANGARYNPLVTEEWPPVPSRVQTGERWVEPDGRVCPASHPVKGKLSSGRFHLPGMAVYDRTIPDRCYATAEAAELDGLQRSKH